MICGASNAEVDVSPCCILIVVVHDVLLKVVIFDIKVLARLWSGNLLFSKFVTRFVSISKMINNLG